MHGLRASKVLLIICFIVKEATTLAWLKACAFFAGSLTLKMLQKELVRQKCFDKSVLSHAANLSLLKLLP